MWIEQQLSSLELSKHLRKLGIKQKSLFYWIRVHTQDENIDGYVLAYSMNLLTDAINPKEIYSAFTVAELGEIIPDFYSIRSKVTNEYICYWTIEDVRYPFSDKLEVNARAKILIFLLENKLMELPNDKENKADTV